MKWLFVPSFLVFGKTRTFRHQDRVSRLGGTRHVTVPVSKWVLTLAPHEQHWRGFDVTMRLLRSDPHAAESTGVDLR